VTLEQREKLRAAGLEVTDTDLNATVIGAFPQSPRQFGQGLSGAGGILKIPSDDLVDRVLSNIDRRAVQRDKDQAYASHERKHAAGSKHGHKKGPLKCWHCQKEGHPKFKCPDLKSKPQRPQQGKAKPQDKDRKKPAANSNASDLTCVVFENGKEKFALSANTSTVCKKFVLDSAFTVHICQDRAAFATYQKLDSSRPRPWS